MHILSVNRGTKRVKKQNKNKNKKKQDFVPSFFGPMLTKNGGRMKHSKGLQGQIDPGATAERTKPLHTGHPLHQLSHQGAPKHVNSLFIISVFRN